MNELLLRAYMQQARTMNGWFEPSKNIPILKLLNECHRKNGITGNLGEIGLWEGKSFIPLMLMASNGESVIGVDTFSKPWTYARFAENCRAICKEEFDRALITTSDSCKIRCIDYIAISSGKFRVWSIDGGHDENTAEHDIIQAVLSSVSGAFIIIDDFLSSEWISVNGVVCKLIFQEKIFPFAIAAHRLYSATSIKDADWFFNEIMISHDFSRIVRWSGHTLAVI